MNTQSLTCTSAGISLHPPLPAPPRLGARFRIGLEREQLWRSSCTTRCQLRWLGRLWSGCVRQDLAAVRAELTAQIDELRGTQLAMLSAFAHAWPLLKQHEPLTLPSLVPTLQLVLPRAVAANATEADARVGALLQENARLKREARIAAEERDSAVDSLERVTQKYNDLKRMRNIKRVTFVGGA